MATWREELVNSCKKLEQAQKWRRDVFRAALDAGLSYRDIAKITGLSHTGVGKIAGPRNLKKVDREALINSESTVPKKPWVTLPKNLDDLTG